MYNGECGRAQVLANFWSYIAHEADMLLNSTISNEGTQQHSAFANCCIQFEARKGPIHKVDFWADA